MREGCPLLGGSDYSTGMHSCPYSFFFPPLRQAGCRGDGPSGPEGEARGGGAQQESADVPPASRPPPQDGGGLQSEPSGEGVALLDVSYTGSHVTIYDL